MGPNHAIVHHEQPFARADAPLGINAPHIQLACANPDTAARSPVLAPTIFRPSFYSPSELMGSHSSGEADEFHPTQYAIHRERPSEVRMNGSWSKPPRRRDEETAGSAEEEDMDVTMGMGMHVPNRRLCLRTSKSSLVEQEQFFGCQIGVW
jgi:hypothetical protein